MSSIYSNGGYLVYQRVYKDKNGKRKKFREYLGIKDTKDGRARAKREQKKLDREWEEKNFAGSSSITIIQAKELFQIDRKHRAAKTWIAYRNGIDLFISIVGGNIFVRDITPAQIREFEDYLREETYKKSPLSEPKPYSEATIKSYFTTLKVFFGFLQNERYIDKSPVYVPKTKRIKKKFMSEDEAQNIINKFKLYGNDNWYRALLFFYHSGFRKIDVVRLKWTDIDWIDKIIYYTKKGGDIATFPLLPEIEELLIPIKKKYGQVFGFETTDSLGKLGKKISKFSQGKYSFHDFRRTFGNRWAQIVKLPELQKLMGHESPLTTAEFYQNPELNDIVKKREEFLANGSLTIIKY